MHIAGRLASKGRVAVGNQRPDAHHVGVYLLKKQNIPRQRFRRLPRQADQAARSHFIAELLQIGETAEPRFMGHPRIEGFIYRLVRSFDAKQEAVCARLLQRAVFLPRPFPDGECHRQSELLHITDNRRQPLRRKPRVLSRLHHRREIPVRFRFFRQSHDLLRREPVPLRVPVVPAEAAVQAVLPAVRGKFDQPAQMHLVAHDRMPHPIRRRRQRFLRARVRQQGGKLFRRKPVRPLRLINQRVPRFLLHRAALLSS